MPLPTYPFERQRCWIEPPATGSATTAVLPAAAAQADLADWFWSPVWKQAPLPQDATLEGGWLIFLDRGGLGERIAMRLRRAGLPVSTVVAGPEFQAEGETFTIDPERRQDYDSLLQHLRAAGELPGRVLHLWGVTGGDPGFAPAQTSGLLSLILFEQAVTAIGGESSPVHLAMVADGLHDVADGDPVHPGKATVLGAVKVIHQESSRLTCAAIDVIPAAAGSAAEERLIDQLLAEASLAAAGPADVAVAFRGRRRWVRSFERVRLADPAVSRLVPGGAYLITDGVHGAGALLAERLLRTLNARVAMVVPPQFPPPERWDGWEGLPAVPPGADVLGTAVRRLSGLSAEERERLWLVRAEPGDAAAATLAQVRAAFGPLQGAFHTAGAFTGGLIQLKTAEALRAAIDPAALGAEAWLAAFDADPNPPAFVLLMSSTLAFTGGLGQVDIAAAGAFLDAVARQRAGGEGPFTIAAHWDPYQWEGWLIAAAGGAAGGLQPEEIQKNVTAWGVAAEKSGEALRRLLGSPLPQVIVASRDLPAMIAETDSITAESLFAQMAPLHRGEKAQRPGGSAPPTSSRATSARATSPASGKSCSGSRRSALRTASLSSAATPSWRSRWSPRSAPCSRPTCR